MKTTVPTPEVSARPLVTAGREQLLVLGCPHCSRPHRHLAVGVRRAPCGGGRYTVVAAREDAL